MCKKLGYLIGALLLVVTLTFFLMKAIPGDPFVQEQALPAEIHQALRDHYGLDDPWSVQYMRYLRSIVTGDLGPSFKYPNRTVNDIIREGFPVSATLGLEALALALVSGIAVGTVAAVNHRKWEDNTALVATSLALSIPSFLVAAFLQYLLAYKWRLLPVALWGTFAQTILPTISLAALPAAFIARLVRSKLIETLREDYIKTARSKGLSRFAVVWRHGLKNALLPAISYFGQLTANILVGSFVIEKIFSIPGLGQAFVNSVSNRDYTVIMGTTVFYSAILLTAVFITEIIYGMLDPRVREASE